MELNYDILIVIIDAVLGFYMVVFVFIRKFNEVWNFVKLGRKVYQALPPGDMGWPLIGSSLLFTNSSKSSHDPDSFINHLISKYLSFLSLILLKLMLLIYIYGLLRDTIFSYVKERRELRWLIINFYESYYYTRGEKKYTFGVLEVWLKLHLGHWVF